MSSPTITFNVGALPQGFCPATWQLAFQGFVNALTGTVNGLSQTQIYVSPSIPNPASGFNSYILLLTDSSGNPIQFYAYANAQWEPIQPQTVFADLVDSGSMANAYQVTISNYPVSVVYPHTPTTALKAGTTVFFKTANANSGASTLTVINQSQAVGTVTYPSANITIAGAAIAGGTLQPATWYILQYDGTNFEILNPSPIVPKFVTFTGITVPAVNTGGFVTLGAHGFGFAPLVRSAQWVCNSNGDGNYIAGMTLESDGVVSYVGGNNYPRPAFVLVADSTNCYLAWSHGSDPNTVQAYQTWDGTQCILALTPAKWTITATFGNAA